MDINCPHFDFCSGCTRNKNVDRFHTFEEAKLFFKEQGISNIHLHVGSPIGWRCRAKLATRGPSTHPMIGLFEEGSHHVVDIPFCQVHHPAMNRAIEILREWIKGQNIELYHELTGKGFLRYVQLAVERPTLRIQMVLVVNERQDKWEACEYRKSLEDLWNQGQGLWHSLWLNFNTKRDNIIFSPRWELAHGEKWLWENFCGKDVCFHPASFAQANPEMFEQLIKHIKPNIPPGTRLLEFYAGVGAISLALVESCQKVCCVEIVPLGQECFIQSQSHLPIELASRLSYVCGSAGTQHHLLKGEWDVVLLDPPRKGLEAPLIEALCEDMNVKRLIYVSCGLDSFKRDCQRFLQSRWKLIHAEAFLFFPGSDHLETLAVFDRVT